MMMRSILEIAALLATALGIPIAVWQLWRTRQQAVTSFEDQIAREYRQIARAIPVAALLGHDLPDDEFQEALEDLYNYVDLSNEQVFLRQLGRIRRNTWRNWCDGIRSNLARPSFRRAWDQIKVEASESFEELRRLENEGFHTDPRNW